MPNDVEMIITSEGDNGILFEGTEGRFFVNRGKLVGNAASWSASRSRRWPRIRSPRVRSRRSTAAR